MRKIARILLPVFFAAVLSACSARETQLPTPAASSQSSQTASTEPVEPEGTPVSDPTEPAELEEPPVSGTGQLPVNLDGG